MDMLMVNLLCWTIALIVPAMSVTVSTESGPVIGRTESVLNQDINIFLGIPFAKPPVGNLRFKRPQPVDRWRKPINATKLPNTCWQVIDTAFDQFPGVDMWNPNTDMSEDCLYLNIWAPAKVRNAAIVVWIYGGSFSSGSSTLDLTDGRYLAAEGNIIVMSMQYRIGPLGFLYLDSEAASGNMGLFDQYMAINWMRDNAAMFGGDPDRLTLLGESAGAAAVSLHLLSPETSQLIKGAIMLSSSALASYAVHEPNVAQTRSMDLAKLLDCDDESGEDTVLKCLLEASAVDITARQWEVDDNSFFHTAFVPTVDGSFLQDMPQKLMENDEFKKTSILLGSVENEGTYFLVYNLPNVFPLDYARQLNKEEFLNATRRLVSAKYGKLGTDLIEFEYGQSYEFSHKVDYRRMLDLIYGDSSFICPVLSFAEAYAKAGQDAYVYQYLHRTSVNPWPEWMGVMHGYEIDLIFGQAFNDNLGYTQEEREFSKRLIQYFTNYAKTGDPNRGGKGVEYNWPKHSKTNKEYITLSTEPPIVRHGLHSRQCAFWTEFIPQFMEDSTKTCTNAAITHHLTVFQVYLLGIGLNLFILS